MQSGEETMKPFFHWAAAACAAVLLALPARAQNFPERPIRLIVPQAPGSATDVFIRLLTPKWSELLGQPIVVDNRPGAGAIIGTEAVAKAPADGYTLLFGGSQTHAINKSLYSKLSYDPITDFTPVGRVGAQAMLLVSSTQVPVKNFSELLTHARQAGTGANFASSGNGSSAHLGGALMNAETGLKAQHVPYRAIAQGLTDLLSGQIMMMFYPFSALQGHIQAGKLNVMAVASEKRTSYLPQVPTTTELGFPNIQLTAWFAVYAPAGTHRRNVDILYSALEKAVNDPDVQRRMAATGTDPYLAGPDEMARFGPSEITRYRRIIQLAGATAD
jgi:tripartite-type tricarboxylate transporter receptor subunit TctC